MLRPMPLPTERTALLVAASSMPSRRPPRGPVLPKRMDPMALPMPGPESEGAGMFARGVSGGADGLAEGVVAVGELATRARSFSAALSRFTGVS